MNERPFRPLIAAVLLCLPLAAACGDEGLGPEAAASGTYTLATVNELELPAKVYTETTEQGTLEAWLLDGRVVLTDGRYSARLVSQVRIDDTPYPQRTDREEGDYTVSGETVTFRPTGDDAPPSYQGTLRGDTLRVIQTDSTYGTFRFVFVKG